MCPEEAENRLAAGGPQAEEKSFRIFLRGCIEIWRKWISLPGLINVKAEDVIRNTCLHKIKSNNVEKQGNDDWSKQQTFIYIHIANLKKTHIDHVFMSNLTTSFQAKSW